MDEAMSEPVRTRPFAPFEWLLSGRYLRARRKEGFISVIAGVCIVEKLRAKPALCGPNCHAMHAPSCEGPGKTDKEAVRGSGAGKEQQRGAKQANFPEERHRRIYSAFSPAAPTKLPGFGRDGA